MAKSHTPGIRMPLVLTLAALALVAWLGYSAYDIYDSGKERVVAEVNYDAVTNYLNGLSADETTE